LAHSPIDSVPPTAAPAPNKPSLMGNLLMNIIIPTVIMTQLNDENRLGPVWSMLVALMFPLGYGIREGLISIMLTGGMALLKLPPEYIAIKEAAIPTLLGLLTVISIKTPYPLVRTFLYNEQVLQVDKIAAALKQYGNERRFDQVLTNSSWLIASSFLLSGVLNYVLAKWIVVSQPGTPAFTAELGRMTLLSYPVIVLPSTLVLAATLYYLISNIEKLTHMAMADIMQAT